MWGATVTEKKRVLRTAALSQRSALSPEECCSRSDLIQGKALCFRRYISARAVALYSPVQNEVRTERIMHHAFQAAKEVFYPRMVAQSVLQLVQIDSVADLRAGRFGIPEPLGERQFRETEGERVVFVPGAVFDCRGNRLGRGQGWYDRLLSELDGAATFVGLAYEFQLAYEVPAEEWDQRVHFIITENRLIDCAREAIRPSRAP